MKFMNSCLRLDKYFCFGYCDQFTWTPFCGDEWKRRVPFH